MAEDTIFDRILRREIPASIVYEDDDVLAFNDVNPQAPIHVLVIPKKKMASLREARDAADGDLAAFIKGISRTAAHLGLDENGYRTVFNSGRDAQQTVSYVHAHILGGRSLSWPPG